MIAETSGPYIVVFTGDSAFLYSVIKWTVNVTRVWVKMLSLLQILLVPITPLSQGPRSQGPGSLVSGSRVSGLRVPGPGT